MKYLYLENFRGFSDTVIPIKSVNFLVGENSTGKTSVLALLSLLSSPNFWISQNFNAENHEFGGYEDILSVNARERGSFSIGFFEKIKKTEAKKETLNCKLMTYKDHRGVPEIYYLTKALKERSKLASVIFQRNTFRYRIFESEICEAPTGEVSEIFRFLLQQHKTTTSGFKNLRIPMLSRQAVIPILALLESRAFRKEEDVHEIAFEIPFFIDDLTWLAPIRTKPKRTYDGYGKPFNPEGEHTPYVLRRQLARRTKAENFRKALVSFGEASGLFKEVKIRRFGKDANSPFELQVVLAQEPLSINSVGYGVSQALPIIVELLSRKIESWFAIQQPEIHLHPRAQAALGDIVFHLANEESKHFLIETHSDFIIDRFRSNYRQSKIKETDAQVLYFERENDGNKVTAIPIQPSGEYPKEQPASFREFFLKEQMRILGL